MLHKILTASRRHRDHRRLRHGRRSAPQGSPTAVHSAAHSDLAGLLCRRERRRHVEQFQNHHHHRNGLGRAVCASAAISTAAALSVTNTFGNNGNNNNRFGFLVGGTWGYNWQWNQIVLGTESDFQGTFDNCRNDNNNNGFFLGNNSNGCVVGGFGLAPIAGTGLSMLGVQTLERRMDWLSTSRVRAGYLVLPTLLLYGTGGVAFGHIKRRASSPRPSQAFPPVSLFPASPFTTISGSRPVTLSAAVSSGCSCRTGR